MLGATVKLLPATCGQDIDQAVLQNRGLKAGLLQLRYVRRVLYLFSHWLENPHPQHSAVLYHQVGKAHFDILDLTFALYPSFNIL
eukprot:s2030_g2.t1